MLPSFELWDPPPPKRADKALTGSSASFNTFTADLKVTQEISQCELAWHHALQGLSHVIFCLFKKWRRVFASIDFKKYWSSFVILDYIWALKLFPVVCCYKWQGLPLVPEASCAVSGFAQVLKSDPPVVSSACGRRNEAPRRTRENTSGTQGKQGWTWIETWKDLANFFKF